MKPSKLQTAESVPAVVAPVESAEATVPAVADLSADDTESADAAEATDANAADAEPEVAPLRIVSIESCPSLSGRSILTYHIGFSDSSDNDSETGPSPEPQIRVYKNTGKGQFNRDWLDLSEIVQVLAASVNITSSTLQCMYPGKSNNSAGFLLAALKHEGLVDVSPLNQRAYALVEPEAFLARCRALMASTVSLDADQVPAKPLPAKPLPDKPLPIKRSKG